MTVNQLALVIIISLAACGLAIHSYMTGDLDGATTCIGVIFSSFGCVIIYQGVRSGI